MQYKEKLNEAYSDAGSFIIPWYLKPFLYFIKPQTWSINERGSTIVFKKFLGKRYTVGFLTVYDKDYVNPLHGGL